MKNLIPYFVQEAATEGVHHGYLEAYTIFIDLSGFTKLTETLMRQGHEGAEKLSKILNDVFGPMVRLVHQRGGMIPHFAGDAFTAIFRADGPQALSAIDFLHTARDVRDIFKAKDFRFEDFQIGIKLGLSYGEVEWGIVGNKRRSFYFRGPAVDGCAENQMRASEQEIVLDSTLKLLLPPGVAVSPLGNAGHYLYSGSSPKTPPKLREVELPELDPAFAARYLPGPVIELNGRGEFRSVVSVFCSFEGIESHDELDRFTTVVLDQIHNFSGYFKEVDFGDKGGVLVGFFGAPVSFENNVDRALEFVVSITEELQSSGQADTLRFRMGITYGTAYTGIVGGEERCQYAAVGNRVNLAARLMTYADWGEILVDEEIYRSRHFKFLHKGNIRYKGIEGEVPTFKLVGRQTGARPSYSGMMVGRERELKTLQTFAEECLQERNGRLAYIYGEPGIGKSRLSYELRKYLEGRHGVSWFTCVSDQILKKPFNPFVYFLKNYFDFSAENSVSENEERFEKNFQWLVDDSKGIQHPDSDPIRKEIIRTKPVLAALIGLGQGDAFWEQLDARGRYQNTIDALSNLFIAESLVNPVVLELEDGHWVDTGTLDFLKMFINRLRSMPILLLINSRYSDEGTKPVLIDKQLLEKRGIPILETDLNILQGDVLRTFTENQLGSKISEDFLAMLLRTTNGNPFYLEQLLEYFAESNLLEQREGLWHIKDSHIKLSNSIQSILTARIDRLSTIVKETVKAAAVIGREFELPVLTEVMRGQENFLSEHDNVPAVLQEQIKSAEQVQIWRAMNELRYIFKHSLLREVVYDMQLRTRLRELHQAIGEAIEKVYAGRLDQHYFDLAFHYEQAEVVEKTRLYLEKAADFARRNFMNQQSLTYYEKLLQWLREPDDRIIIFKTLLKKGKVLELVGEWDVCRAVYNDALHLAQRLDDHIMLGRANNNLGYLLMLQGLYKEARQYLEIAAVNFEEASDEVGIAKVYGDLGNLYFRQGSYELAKASFVRSLELSENHPYSSQIAQIVGNLGLTYMNQGNYDEGIRQMQKILERSVEIGDKQGMASLNINLGIVYFEKGDYEAAGSCFEEGLRRCEELGNKLLTSIGTGCLGSVYEKKGDFNKAMELFEKDLLLTEELGDKQGIAIASGLIGELYSVVGEFDEAEKHLRRTVELSRELGYKKGLAKAVNTLGDVYYFTKQHEKSLEFYNQAIEVTREINNKLVLGSSLSEKAIVLLAMKRFEDVREILKESSVIAEELGNSELIFEGRLVNLKLCIAENKLEEAKAHLELLLNEYPGTKERAALYYNQFLIDSDTDILRRALACYQELFAKTPRFLYKQRIDELQLILK